MIFDTTKSLRAGGDRSIVEDRVESILGLDRGIGKVGGASAMCLQRRLYWQEVLQIALRTPSKEPETLQGSQLKERFPKVCMCLLSDAISQRV